MALTVTHSTVVATADDGTSDVSSNEWNANHTISGLGIGVETFLETPSSANLASAVTDETGTGALVFANTPTLVTPVIGAATGTSLVATGKLEAGTTLGISTDVLLERDAAQTLAQRNSTNAQTLRVYNTYTDTNNYERLSVGWSANTALIAMEKAGTGSDREVQIASSGLGGQVKLNATYVDMFNGATHAVRFVNGTLELGTNPLRWHTNGLGWGADAELDHNGAGLLKLTGTTANTNTVANNLTIRHATTGTPAAGIGSGVAFEVETAADNYETGAVIEAVTTDVTSTSEDFDLVFKTMATGAAVAEQFRVKSTGQSSFFPGTATPAGGSTSARIVFGSTAGFGIYIGSGAPTVSAGQGSLYLRSDGSSTSTRGYINTDGGTTWTAITTAT